MARLEDLTKGAVVRGILPDELVTVVDVDWHGTAAITLTYRGADGRLGNEIIYREREPTLTIADVGRPWSFDGESALFRLVSEAYRIRLAYLFDPVLAVHTSLVEPLPHQITAVYEEMLPRQPLRFLLADDPGAGKTIMTGLFIKELLIRGDLRRCLIVCPGSLVEQWQDELDQRFKLPFEIITNDRLESARTGNAFAETNLAICRLDKLSRDEDAQAKLKQTDWDLIVVDEAHKLSATFFGGEIKYTKRYRLGQALSQLTRHFLLLTATPHNGKEEDFQLFMALLDADRFEGKPRENEGADAADLMRRLVKEKLLKFDGTPLFPERIAYPVGYTLSAAEADLYRQVTNYVREEFNRADTLDSNGRRGTVGFALTTLQRRLASSPEAIYQSLRRRRERLEKRLREEQLLKRGAEALIEQERELPLLDEDALDDLDDAPDAEVEAVEEAVVDRATASRTITELQAEIATLTQLEALALQVRRSGLDRKWEELASLLQTNAEMFGPDGAGHKLVIFTEHRDTLNYLAERIRTLLGRDETVVTIHGGMLRDDRREAQNRFLNHPDALVLVATDAAGEGVNLQRAHLMVNYDLPWNPNRIEQRFGRIHRIGQTEVCHLWNLIASETREGEVFKLLFEKLEEERKALGGQVFDVLGKVRFENNQPLRDLVLQAIRYGDDPEVRARLSLAVESGMDREHLRALLEERALARDTMDIARVQAVREDMERAAARRLQPHFIADFFLEAFRLLGGSIRMREPGRYQVTHVPAAIRHRDHEIGTGRRVSDQYERVTFEKDLISLPGKPMADFVCPGHPLLDAVIDLVLERHRDLLKRGAVLVDGGPLPLPLPHLTAGEGSQTPSPTPPPVDTGRGATDGALEPRALVYLEHAIQDARTDGAGNRRTVSRRMQFVELDGENHAHTAGYAPYLDYRPPTEEERALIEGVLDRLDLRATIEQAALDYAITTLVPGHLHEVRSRREELVDKTKQAVRERLLSEINHWDHRAHQIRLQEEAGRTPKLNSARARQRADDLQARLNRRMEELEQERQLSALPPVMVGAALVIPVGLLAQLRGESSETLDAQARETRRVELAAMAAVMRRERELGYAPRDVSAEKCGYDVESRMPGTGRLRFIEVKGRAKGAETVTVTKNEILTGLNQPEDFMLALVEVDGETAATPRYVVRPFTREPDFGATGVIYSLGELLARGEVPSPGPSPS